MGVRARARNSHGEKDGKEGAVPDIGGSCERRVSAACITIAVHAERPSLCEYCETWAEWIEQSGGNPPPPPIMGPPAPADAPAGGGGGGGALLSAIIPPPPPMPSAPLTLPSRIKFIARSIR